jgi:hypothetical protein
MRYKYHAEDNTELLFILHARGDALYYFPEHGRFITQDVRIPKEIRMFPPQFNLLRVGRDSSVGIVAVLWSERSGDRNPVEARFSAHVQTGPGVHAVSYTMGTRSLSRGLTFIAYTQRNGHP